MYIPKPFEESRPEVLHQFIRQHPLATLIINDAEGLAADHIPLLLRPEAGPSGKLLGHVARSNPLWQKAGDGIPCLLVFHGIDGYISPNGYASKQETGKVVPTWNYEVVHVHGKVRAIDDPAALMDILQALTQTHEADQPAPWRIADAPPDYIERMLQAIVGIEVEIERIAGKAKLSQNQPGSNRQSLVNALQGRDDRASQEMAKAIEDRGGAQA
ncbi:FMN-binding negative transcriptional regulator [Polaromonas hydrogenivorans]|uniref:FMN-binding negative transcriptional regulator n=1 Tax=Polaromonas hydrogenivorans TaxID=335476 RepID=A0AAU7LQQ0_9BURK